MDLIKKQPDGAFLLQRFSYQFQIILQMAESWMTFIIFSDTF